MDEKRSVYEALTPPIQPRIIFTFRDFIREMRNTWNMIHKGTQFVHGHPVQDDKNYESINPPIISYRVHQKVPCQVGSVREIKPRIRTTVKDPYNSQEQVTIFAQRFTYYIDFGLWDSNWDRLDKFQEMFEDFVLTWTGALKQVGLSELIFEEATEDIPRSSVWRHDLVSTHIIYRIDLDETRPVNNQVIEQIKVKLKKQEEN
jgi:hypothetical protein